MASVSAHTWSAVDDYVERHLIGADPVLAAVLEASHAAGLPNIAVSPSQGKLLNVLAKSVGAKRVLEIGTLGGYSAVWMARALGDDGRIISIEADARHAEIARSNVARAGVADKVEIWIGAAKELLPKVAASGDGLFDFSFIDADKASIPEYIDWAVKLSRPGALILVDNVIRRGAVIEDDSTDDDVLGVRRMHELLAVDGRASATTIQTVGAKGYDGFTLIVVNAQ